jgi:hypothetical protein
MNFQVVDLQLGYRRNKSPEYSKFLFTDERSTFSPRVGIL